MKYVGIWFLLTKIESDENRNPIFHFYFFNKDISVTNKVMNFSGNVHVVSEGSVSQIFDLGPSFDFMLCRKNILKKYQKLPVFFNIKS